MVKTYPNLSVKYDELVCTAGVLEDGSWIRLYPIPFRRMSYESRYKKYSWIEVDIRKNQNDMRPESFMPIMEKMKIGAHIGTENNWERRKEYVLKEVYDDMEKLIDLAHNNELSIAVFKPKEVMDFYFKDVLENERQRYQEKMNRILQKRKQMKLMDNGLMDIDLVSKPDYLFHYKFCDINGKESDMKIEDWEAQALYRNCLKRNGDREKTLKDVRKKYWDDFYLKKDLYLILGTTLEFHRRKARNPFTIIGTFTPKKECVQR